MLYKSVNNNIYNKKVKISFIQNSYNNIKNIFQNSKKE